MKNIEIMGAKENNLKDIDVKIHFNKITVVTGVSGSGKSSLVFDTVYAESERLFLESLPMDLSNITSYMKKPNVYKIRNLPPSIAISQKKTNKNPRSTVGTVTGISKYIRLLFAKIATINSDKEWREGDFSYNNPQYWCKKCKGMGEEYVIDESKVIDYKKSIIDGGLLYWWQTNKDYYFKLMKEVSKHYNIDLYKPIYLFDKNTLDFILHGESDIKFTIRYKNYKGKYRTSTVKFLGLYNEIYIKLKDIDQASTFRSINKFLKKTTCSECGGTRLAKEILEYYIYGKNIHDLLSMNLSELKNWLLKNINLKKNLNDSVYRDVSSEIVKRIENLEKVKLGYLSLDRSIPSLSGGESQRLRLANQISSELSGLLYVLDEPTMGLHVNDVKNICEILLELKEKGNTLLIVEHNPEVINSADRVIDIGPKGGIYGGYLVFDGTPKNLIKENNLTGEYLRNYKNYKIDSIPNDVEHYIEIKGAKYNNIEDQYFKIPLKQLVVITGVSGSGKSSFTDFILEPSIANKTNINCDLISGFKYVNKVIKVDQSPIGRSPKSNVATYTGLFDLIRDLFTNTEDAKKNKLTKSHFSFNIEGGRCPKCKGDGKIKIDMSFMPDTYVECDVCKGKRYKKNILEVMYNNKNIYDVLEMTVIEAYEFFNKNKKILNILQCLIDVGLDYIKIGQSALTISGGEAQRIKLAKYLSNESSKENLYILDEATVGLHGSDVQKLLNLVKKIVKRKNTVVMIEHNINIIRNADYIIDMGKESGPNGGKVIDIGTIQEIKNRKKASICNFL